MQPTRHMYRTNLNFFERYFEHMRMHDQVRRQKQEAVEREDYDRAMELKELEKQLQNRRSFIHVDGTNSTKEI